MAKNAPTWAKQLYPQIKHDLEKWCKENKAKLVIDETAGVYWANENADQKHTIQTHAVGLSKAGPLMRGLGAIQMRVFSDYGCTIQKRDGHYFMQYDSGESSGGLLMENEITIAEVDKARISEENAYEVILAAKNRASPRKVTS